MKEYSKTTQLVINMTAQSVSFVTGLLISFFLTPFIVNRIGSEAYGFVGLANNFIGYVSIITTALNSMASRFITIAIHQEDFKKTNEYFSSLVISNIIIAVPLSIASIFIVVFIDKLVNISTSLVFDVRMLWALLFANFILGLVFNVFSVSTFARNRLDLSSLRSIESNVLRVIILVVMFWIFKPSVWFLGLSTLVCGIYVIITNIYYTKKLLPFVKVRKEYFDFDKIKELISSGMWNSVSHLSSTLYNGLDLLITNLFVTAVAMGTVSISKTIPGMILSAFGMIASVFAPELTISYAKGEYEEMKLQLISAIRILSFFACIPIAFLVVFSKEFFSLWVPTQDSDVLYLLTLLGVLVMPTSLPLEPLWNIFTVVNKVKQSSLFMLLIAAVSTVTVFVLLNFANNDLQKMCIIVGVSSVLGVFKNLLFLPLYGAKCLNYNWKTFYPVIMKNIVSTVIIICFAFIIKHFIFADSWIKLIIAGLLVAVVSCIFNYFFILKKSERKLLINKVKGVLVR